MFGLVKHAYTRDEKANEDMRYERFVAEVRNELKRFNLEKPKEFKKLEMVIC